MNAAHIDLPFTAADLAVVDEAISIAGGYWEHQARQAPHGGVVRRVYTTAAQDVRQARIALRGPVRVSAERYAHLYAALEIAASVDSTGPYAALVESMRERSRVVMPADPPTFGDLEAHDS